MKPLISVIIPIYNVEKYLRQCLDSVVNQTYSNLEIILVDDCSPDNSIQIMREYQSTDSRIKIVSNEKNLGLGLARNEGLKLATGEFLHFLDSDDWLELNTYEELVKIATETNAEAVHFRFTGIYPDKKEVVPFYFEYANKIIDPKTSNDPWVKNWLGYAWCVFYKLSFIKENDLKFNDYPCLEDQEFSIKVLSKLKSVYFSEKILLNYRRNRPGSLLTTSYKHYNCAIDSLKTNIEVAKLLPVKQREILMEASFQIACSYIRFAYCMGFVSFKEYKNLILSLDYSVFEKELKNYCFYIYYKELKKYPDILVRLKLNFQFFLRKRVNFLYKFLRLIKSNILFLKNI